MISASGWIYLIINHSIMDLCPVSSPKKHFRCLCLKVSMFLSGKKFLSSFKELIRFIIFHRSLSGAQEYYIFRVVMLHLQDRQAGKITVQQDYNDDQVHMDGCYRTVYNPRPPNVLQPIRRSGLSSVKSVKAVPCVEVHSSKLLIKRDVCTVYVCIITATI